MPEDASMHMIWTLKKTPTLPPFNIKASPKSALGPPSDGWVWAAEGRYQAEANSYSPSAPHSFPSPRLEEPLVGSRHGGPQPLAAPKPHRRRLWRAAVAGGLPSRSWTRLHRVRWTLSEASRGGGEVAREDPRAPPVGLPAVRVHRDWVAPRSPAVSVDPHPLLVSLNSCPI